MRFPEEIKSWWIVSGSRTELILCFLIVSLICPTLASMEITAFEYNRKFHKPLDLGECCQREVAILMGNNSYYIEEQKCSLYQRGTVSRQPLEINDSKNVLITSADKVVPYLGLCGGEAASFLGILNSGDCVAIEIASRLSFTDKTMVRAFVGNYQKSLDTLEASGNILEGMDSYYKDQLYLRCLSYGTLELILVQFHFNSALATQEAKKIKTPTLQMSSYMKQIHSQVGLPRNVVVVSLSTASQEPFQTQQFKRADWDRALRYVEVLELNIHRTRSQLSTNNFPLIYRLQPFLEDYRLTAPALWEEISMLEVQLRQALNVAKTTARKCRGNRVKLCRRVRELKRVNLSTD